MNTEDPKSKELSLEKRREIIKTIKQELKKTKKLEGEFKSMILPNAKSCKWEKNHT